MIESAGVQLEATEGVPMARRARRCVVTRSVQSDEDLIRFVVDPAGFVVADLRARLPGRGVWVTTSRKALERAVSDRLLERGFQSGATVDGDLPDRVASMLRQTALGRLGLARKAGQVVAGFSKVEAVVGRGSATIVVTASDAAAEGRRKIDAAAAGNSAAGSRPAVIDTFTAAELGLALGRSHVIHAAVLQGAAGRGFVNAAARLHRYEQNIGFEDKR